ncbi:hypothetical protein DPEC_G00015170 [Dallia pectoralis]|uniref:Uncharacterized protein n=1 Tax=Dallia pectoralis TaxID=75939 RepID=A0ACC2HMB8_DALPE|nr:hypothetical protein DPEC_G00015170 [Dallia pectoralis]
MGVMVSSSRLRREREHCLKTVAFYELQPGAATDEGGRLQPIRGGSNQLGPLDRVCIHRIDMITRVTSSMMSMVMM